MFVPTVEKQSKGALYAGQKICHEKYGRGIIVGFSLFTDEPLVYFYSEDFQRHFGDKIMSVGSETISALA